MRLFFCVELERGLREALAEIAARLKGKLGPGAKWVARDNLHITVRFLGEVEDSSAEGLAELGAEAAKATARFSFPLTGLGAFPTPRRARVIWAGPAEDPEAFAKLVRRVEAGVQALGLPPERKEAKAHVTLARLKPPRDVAAALAGTPLPELVVEVKALTLMKSQLTPQGPIYTPIGRWELEG
ncbi:RNA 2',3'-cyclic phosphodiesterase [Candidatus Bipolaricaulota bacterium]|nr:RNA 2',3'-cyclic phosphodiesterase [Candidatus Bipolaricaulota bacterium]